MMPHPEFSTWLRVATKGLPSRVMREIQTEFATHYEDALESYLDEGMAQAHAHQAALADLGDPQEAACALRDVHAPMQQYAIASIASSGPAVMIMLLIPVLVAYQGGVISRFLYDIFTNSYFATISMIAVLCQLYMLRKLQLLVGTGVSLRLPSRLIRWGLLILLIPCLLPLAADSSNQTHVVMAMNDPILYQMQTFSPQVANPIYEMALALALMPVSLGWLMLGVRLSNLRRDQLVGLAPLISILFMISGGIIGGMGMSLAAQNLNALSLFTGLAGIIGTIKGAVCTLMFFRAAYRHWIPPSLMA